MPASKWSPEAVKGLTRVKDKRPRKRCPSCKRRVAIHGIICEQCKAQRTHDELQGSLERMRPDGKRFR